MLDKSIVIIGKDALAGTVKTRLGREIGMQCAADIHRILGLHVCRLAMTTGYLVEVSFKGNGNSPFAQELRSMGAQLYAQTSGNLGEIIYEAMQRQDRVIALGMDTPLFTADALQTAMKRDDLCIGPAEDGGYWSIAASRPTKKLFQGIPWSEASVLDHTIQRAKEENLRPFLLQTHYDIDTLSDLTRLLQDSNTPPPLSHSLQERIDHYARGSHPS